MNTLNPEKYEPIAQLQGPYAGVVAEPNGEHLWTCSGLSANTIAVQQLKTADNTISATVTLKKADNKLASGEYVALETENGTVKQVWVSTYGSGNDRLFYFTPGKVSGNITTTVAGLPEGSVRDILWDSTRKLLWATIDSVGLVAISPDTHTCDTSYTVAAPEIRRLAATTVNGKSRIWFTSKSANHFQVSFYDADNKTHRVDLPEGTVSTELFSLAVSNDGKTVWLVAVSGELWKVGNADGNVKDMTFNSTCAFGRPALQILCDRHDYLWVTLPGDRYNPNSALAECLPNGQLKGVYNLSKTKIAHDITYVSTATVPDTFYLTDFGIVGKNLGSASFSPADWVDPAVGKTLTLAGSPDIETEHNTEFAPWTVSAKENGGELKHDIQLDLLVSDSTVAAFEAIKGDKIHLSPVQAQSVKAADKGVIALDTLFAKGLNGSTFNVYGLIRGAQIDSRPLVQAGIFAPVTGITPTLTTPIRLHTNKTYSIPLGVDIATTQDSLKKRAVNFTSGNSSLMLGKGKTATLTEYTDDRGYAGVSVTAGGKAVDKATVEAVCSGRKANFIISVLPMPDSVKLPAPESWKGKANRVAANDFVISLPGAAQGESVALTFLRYGEDKDVYLRKAADNSVVPEKALRTLFVTDDKGTVTLTSGAYGIFVNPGVEMITVTALFAYEDGNYHDTEQYQIED